MNSPTPMPIRAHPLACACTRGPSACCTPVHRSFARARIHLRVCATTVGAPAYVRARASVHPCAFVRGAACVHGHEDPGSKRSRGPSGSDPSTPARIRHTRTPMLRGRTRRCLGGVPGLYPAGLRLPPLFLFSSLLPSSSPALFATPSSSTLLEDLPLSFPFPPTSPCSSSSYPLSSFFSSVPSPPPLLLFFFLFSAFSPLGAARIHVHPRN